MIVSNVQGTEDECVVMMTRSTNAIYPEYFSRARNLLIIITTSERDFPNGYGQYGKHIIAHIKHYFFQKQREATVDHCSTEYQCGLSQKIYPNAVYYNASILGRNNSKINLTPLCKM